MGDDDAGTTVRKCLQEENIPCLLLTHETAPTGLCPVVVNDKGWRTSVAVLDSCEVNLSGVMSQILNNQEFRSCCHFLYTTGFFLEFNSEAALKAARFSLDNNKFFGFNFAAEYLFQTQREAIIEMIKFSDVLYCNREEAQAAAESLQKEINLPEEDSSNLKVIAEYFSKFCKHNQQRPRTVIITNSEKPVTVCVGPYLDKEAEVFEVSVEPLDRRSVIDTNGAGDCFVGGFLA